MNVDGMEFVAMELKYCERCGGLWLRQQGEDGVYCAPCERQASEAAGGGSWQNTRRSLVKARIALERKNGEILFVCEGGNA